MAYVDHRIPAANLIGEAGRGLPQILGVLELGRINIASRAVGVARAAFDAAFTYAQQRVTFGKPIAEHQAIQMKLAEMATSLEAARLLTKNAAERKMAGERCDVEAGMAKLFASETALSLATEAMRIHGGIGYTTDLPGGALLPRRPPHGHRRRNQRDPEVGDRPGPVGARPALGGLGRRVSGATGQSPEHLVGVLAQARNRRHPPTGGVREGHRPVHRPLPAGGAAIDLDEPIVGLQLRVFDHLGRSLRRGPPHALSVEALPPTRPEAAPR